MAYVLSLFFIHFVAAFINILLFTRVFLFQINIKSRVVNAWSGDEFVYHK